MWTGYERRSNLCKVWEEWQDVFNLDGAARLAQELIHLRDVLLLQCRHGSVRQGRCRLQNTGLMNCEQMAESNLSWPVLCQVYAVDLC